MDTLLTIGLIMLVIVPIGLIIFDLIIDIIEIQMINKRRKNCTGAKEKASKRVAWKCHKIKQQEKKHERN